METIYYGHVPPARNQRTSEGCPGVVLRATRGDRNNIPYSKEVEDLLEDLIKYVVELYAGPDRNAETDKEVVEQP